MTDGEKRLAQSLDEFFASDADWSIHDLDGFTQLAMCQRLPLTIPKRQSHIAAKRNQCNGPKL